MDVNVSKKEGLPLISWFITRSLLIPFIRTKEAIRAQFVGRKVKGLFPCDWSVLQPSEATEKPNRRKEGRTEGWMDGWMGGRRQILIRLEESVTWKSYFSPLILLLIFVSLTALWITASKSPRSSSSRRMAPPSELSRM